jgi:hypothetical protein
VPKRRRSFDGGAPPLEPVVWLGSVRRLPTLDSTQAGHPPWIIAWFAPRSGVLEIATIPRGGRVAAVRDALLAGIRRSGTSGAKLELLVDAAQLHRDASEAFPQAKVVVARDPALEYALHSPQAQAVFEALARRHIRARLSVVDGGLVPKPDRPMGAPTPRDGAASSRAKVRGSAPPSATPSASSSGLGDAREGGRGEPRGKPAVVPSIARVLRLVPDLAPREGETGRAPAVGRPPPVAPTAMRPPSWPTPEPNQVIDLARGRASASRRHVEDLVLGVEADARTPRELVEALVVDRRALATDDVSLEAVAHANIALIAAFIQWDEGHAHGFDDVSEDALDEVRPLDLVLELLATHRGATIPTMDPHDLEAVLFDLLPEHGDFSPEEATEIIGELQRFARFLEREAAHRLPRPHRQLLTDTGIARLHEALSR